MVQILNMQSTFSVSTILHMMMHMKEVKACMYFHVYGMCIAHKNHALGKYCLNVPDDQTTQACSHSLTLPKYSFVVSFLFEMPLPVLRLNL